MNIRKTALDLLLEWEEKHTYINLSVVAAAKDLDEQNRCFLTALVYGAVEKKLTLDYYIGNFASRSPQDLSPRVRNILRLGLYQVLYLDRIPTFAAVNETVKLGKNRGEIGFINAVLREADRQRDNLPMPDRKKNEARYLSVLYSMPLWIVKRFIQDFGEETEELLQAFNERRPLTVRVNTLKIRRSQYISMLEEAEIPCFPTPYSPFGVKVTGSISPTLLPGYEEGLFFVQDEASQISTLALNPQPGETVLDLCACPGGKSFSAAIEMRNSGFVHAFDLHRSKLPLIEKGANRLGLGNISADEQDATKYMKLWAEKADRVICDVPCSGLGVLGKKPDLRYREQEGVLTLPLLQYSILQNAASYVKPGGVLVYSTCTLNRAENQEMAARFLAESTDCVPEDFSVGELQSKGGMLTLTPNRHNTDGFFILKVRRRTENS